MSIGLYARQELIALKRDRRAWAALGCLLVLLVASMVSSAQMRRGYERLRSDAQRAAHEQWLNQGAKNAHSAAHFGGYAFRPLSALAAFEPGLHRLVGTTVQLEAHVTHELRDAPDADGSRLMYLDSAAAFLVRTVLPLLVFLLVAASVAGERERGTLKLLVVQGGALLPIVLGKTLAFAALLLALIAVIFGIAVIANPSAIAYASAIAAAYAVYILVCVFIGMAVSVAAPNPRAAVVALFFVWTLTAVVGPWLAASLAAAAAPMPSMMDTHAALEREIDGDGYDRRTEELRARVLKEHGVTSESELPFDFRGLALQYDEDRSTKIFEAHRANLRAREARQDGALGVASIVVPWLALERWSTAFAHTDLTHAQQFEDAAESYRRALVGRMNDHVKQNHGGDGDASLWSAIEPFAFTSPPPGAILGYAWPAMLVLCGWALLTLAALVTVGRRTAVVGARL